MLALFDCSHVLEDALRQCSFVMPIGVTVAVDDKAPALLLLRQGNGIVNLALNQELAVGEAACAAPVGERSLPLSLEQLCRDIDAMLKDLVITVGGLKFYPYNNRITCHDSEIALSERESLLMLYLCVFGNVAKKVLNRDIWKYNDAVESNTLDMHISRLRNRLRELDCRLSLNCSDGYCSLGSA
jgi:hypothetical protein